MISLPPLCTAQATAALDGSASSGDGRLSVKLSVPMELGGA